MDIKQDIIKRLGPDDQSDKPRYIGYWPNGNIGCLFWWKYGQYHRDNDLPAFEGFYSNGNILIRKWYESGKMIKQEFYNENGDIIKKPRWRNE